MMNRREFLMAGVALTTIAGGAGTWTRAAAQQTLSENDLLDMAPTGKLSILHITDIHAQLKPVYFREPSVNLGVGPVAGLPPHVTGADFLKLYNIEPGSPDAYAMTYLDFTALAQTYGRMGGLDRVATIVKHVRAERGDDNVLLLDGGDTWQGSYTAQQTLGGDMVEVMNALKPDAMTGHWEFTYGTERVQELIDTLPFAFLGSNIYDSEWDEPAFDAWKMFERGGTKRVLHSLQRAPMSFSSPRNCSKLWSFTGLFVTVLSPFEDGKGAGAPGPAEVVGGADAQGAIGHLALAGPTAQLFPDLYQLRRARSPHRMPLCFEPTGSIDGLVAVQSGSALVHRSAAFLGRLGHRAAKQPVEIGRGLHGHLVDADAPLGGDQILG